MKVTIHRLESESIASFADKYGLELLVEQKSSHHFIASFKEFLEDVYIGYGSTPLEAVEALAQRISTLPIATEDGRPVRMPLLCVDEDTASKLQ